MFLTLIVVPIVYVYVDKFRDRIPELLRRPFGWIRRREAAAESQIIPE
jgi:hypothetical protein